MGGYAYQSNYLEFRKSTIPILYQSLHRGCAGIGRQLHPLKAKDVMKDRVIKTKPKNNM